MTKRGFLKKKDIKDIDDQLKKLVDECIKKELPRSKTRGQRNGIDLPLTSWMAGVGSNETSKIIAVTEGRGKFAYSNYWMASEVIADRVAKKRQFTDVQYHLLMSHLLDRYRGRLAHDYFMPEYVLNTNTGKRNLFFYQINKLCKGKTPLNLILSSELTDLILLKTLIDSAVGAKK